MPRRAELKTDRSVNRTRQCPLCLVAGQTMDVNGADRRQYSLCRHCSLIFVDPSQHVSPEEERARYTTHENSIENEGYVRFLNRMLQPLLPYLDDTMHGLDYGCGPGPTLSWLVRQQGMSCEDYDPFFANRPLHPPYDFIVSTECFEHFHRPAQEMERIGHLLKPGGVLGIMTERWTSLDQFARWYYTKDPTHVAFYHAQTFTYLCRRFGYTLLWQDETRVTIVRRDHGPSIVLGS